MTVEITARKVINKRFADGDGAKAQCPKCGNVVKYKVLTKDWRGVWLCPDCWDPKDPQETPVSAMDAVVLHHPAPLLDSPPDNTNDLTAEDGFSSTFGATGATGS